MRMCLQVATPLTFKVRRKLNYSLPSDSNSSNELTTQERENFKVRSKGNYSLPPDNNC